jgi:cytochrome c553
MSKTPEDFLHHGPDTAPADEHGYHPPHLGHHWKDSQQQFEAGKLGMWLFLATELLLFGGLFVAYAVYRGNNPELFQYCAQFLSTPMGAVNTVVLLVSSMTIAFAVRCAQLNQRRGLIAMLILTLLGGFIFMGIKYIEYSDKFQKNLVWGLAFYDAPAAAAVDDVDHVVITAPPAPVHAGDPSVGRALWMQTCFACHGAQGEGVRGQALALRESGFVSSQNDEQLLAFIKRGRMPFDAARSISWSICVKS